MTEEQEPYRPGQRILAKVNGRKMVVVLSLETETKGDRRDHCFRYDKPYFPIIPKDANVELIAPYRGPDKKK